MRKFIFFIYGVLFGQHIMLISDSVDTNDSFGIFVSAFTMAMCLLGLVLLSRK